MLLLAPAVVLWLLLGVDSAAREIIVVSRITGAALTAIGVACWVARDDRDNTSQRGLLIGVLIYDVAAAVLLAYAGAILKMAGIALWPAVLIHSGLAVWCAVGLWRDNSAI